jgi:hypothetical protein
VNENNLWEWLRDVALPLGQYSRIESPDTAPGFPDVHFQVGKYGCGTIELKATDRALRVPFPNEEKGLHTSQLKWIRDNVNEGGIVWIIAETPGVIYIIHGKDAAKFNGARHHDLIDMAWETMSRDNPTQAVGILDSALRVPSNFHLMAEYSL